MSIWSIEASDYRTCFLGAQSLWKGCMKLPTVSTSSSATALQATLEPPIDNSQYVFQHTMRLSLAASFIILITVTYTKKTYAGTWKPLIYVEPLQQPKRPPNQSFSRKTSVYCRKTSAPISREWTQKHTLYESLNPILTIRESTFPSHYSEWALNFYPSVAHTLLSPIRFSRTPTS